jgi:uncharacterized membrane protein
MPRSKSLVFAGVAVMTLYVLAHNERFLIDATHPYWAHIATIKWWLLPHAVAGACALLLAPLQFSDRLRKRYTTLHRVVGRIYVTGVFVLAPLGVYIQYLDEHLGGTREVTIFTIVDAVLLMTTTGIAFLFARRGRITLHRQWMTRSYAVALVFFEGRFIGGVTGWENSEMASTATLWTCLALSLLAADLALHWSDILPAYPPRKPAESVSAMPAL